MLDEMVVGPLVDVIIHEGLWFTFREGFCAGKGVKKMNCPVRWSRDTARRCKCSLLTPGKEAGGGWNPSGKRSDCIVIHGYRFSA